MKKLLTLVSVFFAAIIVIGAAGVLQSDAKNNEKREREERIIRVINEANVENDVDTECKTGGNSTNGGGSIETGDCESESVIINQVNTNIVECCTPTPKPSEKPSETPTPTTKPGDGGNGGNGSNGGDNGGDNGGVGGAEAQKQGNVLGADTLATTGNLGFVIATALQIVGGAVASSGFILLRKSLKNSFSI